MVSSVISAPVGVRYNTTNVTNNAADQAVVANLLTQIDPSDGGKKGVWLAAPLSGPNGQCPKFIVDAIWDFQRHWKTKGVFHNIDGVCDPGGRTINYMLLCAKGGVQPGPDVQPSAPPVISNPRIPGSWQVTNVWAASVGEVGLLGATEVEITQPDNKKFIVKGAGAGFGISLDPSSYKEAWFKGLKLMGKDPASIANILAMLAKNLGYNIGDYLQMGTFLQRMGISLASVTGGRLIANPLNQYLGLPTQISRYLITERGEANFFIAGAGAGIVAGGEGGAMGFGGPAVGPAMLFCPVIGCYGSIGVNVKVGVGAQVMIYHITSVTDK